MSYYYFAFHANVGNGSYIYIYMHILPENDPWRWCTEVAKNPRCLSLDPVIFLPSLGPYNCKLSLNIL